MEDENIKYDKPTSYNDNIREYIYYKCDKKILYKYIPENETTKCMLLIEIFNHGVQILQIGYIHYTYFLINDYCVLVESKNFEDVIRYLDTNYPRLRIVPMQKLVYNSY